MYRKQEYLSYCCALAQYGWPYTKARLDALDCKLPKACFTLSKTTNFTLFQTEKVCRRQFQVLCKWQTDSLPKKKKKLWGKEKLLVTSNFSFSHSMFKRLVLQTRQNQGLFWKGLTHYQTSKF